MVLTALMLYILAVTDAALSGYRAAAGLNPLIYKRQYHQQAVTRAIVVGHARIALVVLLVWAILQISPNTQDNLTRAAQHCLEVYLVYAVLTLFAFFGFFTSSRDVRSLSIVLVLGPFTLFRLPVALLGMLWAVWHQPLLEVVLVCAVAIALMLGVEKQVWQEQVQKLAKRF